MNLRSFRRNWSKETIEEARKLRTSGLTYRDISIKLGIAKSTLFNWIEEIKRPGYITEADKKKHLTKIRLLATKKIKEMRIDRLSSITKRAKLDVKNYSFGDRGYKRSLLAMLYWAEGSKGRGCVTFANTDPSMSYLFITLLRGCYRLDESKFRIRLHLHYYRSASKSKKFWSDLLDIPLQKFNKIYIKKRSNSGKRFRRNFLGICFIKYYSEELRFELLETSRLIAEKYVPIA
ncbi:MAG: transposase [Patescibacteria group bacterium]